MAKKKQNSNWAGWVILGVIGFGIYQFAMVDRPATGGSASPAARSAPPASPASASAPLSAPRFVNVASLNVRHTPDTAGPLIMTLPRGTALRVIDRQNGWLLVDLNPSLEGWVSEQLTTTQAPQKRLVPPAALTGSR
ncbi:MAG: SH3 domain-containing protein [Candidatus Devosia phytovorans]|uniref:SH3 domain-containing protein n=1 Tax=Candidatus Devosia phytovorans TaxID=3121372 RepID=A0AAJ6AYD0_9HYPH|nr:SH3 domain-containing protein [Devosia sp.]WEK02797.1 MAG: SH3 domain-containing protein [Devosia sp.]